MTFEQWQATREEVADVSEFSGFEAPGYVYRLGFIVKQPDQPFWVPINNTEETFATLPEAEAHLWKWYADGELNDAES